jgi:dTDP-glucose 4,6-dehydratase
MRNILVTGGAGFIGSHFIELLLEKYNDIKVFNIDKLTYAGSVHNMPFINSDNHVFIKGDICDSELINSLFREVDFDIVVNFAAESHVDNSIKSPGIFVTSNVVGLQNILSAAKDYWREYKDKLFIQISTDEVYGSAKEGESFFETSILAPNSPYSATKASADLIALSYFKTYKLPVIITRSSNNFGPRQNFEKLIPKTITSFLNRTIVPIYGNGLNIRDWIYVKDNCRLILSLFSSSVPGEIYNIGAGNEFTNLQMVTKIMEKLNISDDQYVFVNDRLGHDFRYSVNTDKILNLNDNFLFTSFEIALNETINYYRNHYK